MTEDKTTKALKETIMVARRLKWSNEEIADELGVSIDTVKSADYDDVVFRLYLAITAPTQEQKQKALKEAALLARNLSEHELARAIKEAEAIIEIIPKAMEWLKKRKEAEARR